MNRNNLTSQKVRPMIFGLFLLGLWFSLFLSLQSGDIRSIGHPGFNFSFLQGIRAAIPLTAAFIAVIMIGISGRRSRPEKFLYIGPLGLWALYGIVGMIASILSPKELDALYWSVSYMAVPLVLWAIVWRPHPFQWIERLILLNWFILLIALAALLTFGFIYLEFASFIVSPHEWLDCGARAWFDKSSHYIRDTGVGRYAALTGILSLSRLWNPKFRSLWTLIFVASMFLLLFSGARTSMAGFALAASIIIVISGGKKTVFSFLILGVILTPTFWTTGIHNDFLDACIFRRSSDTEPDKAMAANIPKLSSNTTSELEAGLIVDERLTPMTNKLTESYDDSSVGTNPDNEGHSSVVNILGAGTIPKDFFKFSGRTSVWKEALSLSMDSPFLGYGFQADRYLLNTHTHNSFIHSLLQTGVLGSIPFMAGLLLAWLLLLRAYLNQFLFSNEQKSMFIQIAGMVMFLSVRAIYESTGAFFGVDWLLLGPILLYLQAVNSKSIIGYPTARRMRLRGLMP